MMIPIRFAVPEDTAAPEEAAAPKAAAAEASLKIFLEKAHDAALAKSAATYETHVVASRELHEAQQHLMKTKRMMQRLESDLREAKAAAVDAIAAVDRKRKAAADAEDGFNSDIRSARHCYGLQSALKCAPAVDPMDRSGEGLSDAPAPVYYAPEPALKCHPVYSPVDPTYRGGETPSVNPYESQGTCETPTYAPTSASYVPQDPNCGGVSLPGSPIGYHPLTGVPQYKTRKMSPSFTPPGSPKPTRNPTTPSYCPSSPPHTAAAARSPQCSPAYKPTTPRYCPSSPPPHSPHTAAAARSRALKWGA